MLRLGLQGDEGAASQGRQVASGSGKGKGSEFSWQPPEGKAAPPKP